MDEAEVEHPVGLVENQNLHARQGQRPGVDQIEQASRSDNQDIDAARQLLLLRPDRDPAELSTAVSRRRKRESCPRSGSPAP